MDSATAFRSSGLAELLLHRSHRLRGDAAGDDQVEVAEVGVYVEGEAVGGDEAGDVDADGGEFGFGVGAGASRRVRWKPRFLAPLGMTESCFMLRKACPSRRR